MESDEKQQGWTERLSAGIASFGDKIHDSLDTWNWKRYKARVELLDYNAVKCDYCSF